VKFPFPCEVLNILSVKFRLASSCTNKTPQIFENFDTRLHKIKKIIDEKLTQDTIFSQIYGDAQWCSGTIS